MTWELIKEDPFYKEEKTFKDSYWYQGAYYESTEEITYKTIYGTDEPYKDGEESVILPSGVGSKDARILHTSEILLPYSDVDEITIADKVYLKDPTTSKYKQQRYVVMNKEDWYVNSGFQLIGTDEANVYLLVKEEKVVSNA